MRRVTGGPKALIVLILTVLLVAIPAGAAVAAPTGVEAKLLKVMNVATDGRKARECSSRGQRAAFVHVTGISADCRLTGVPQGGAGYGG